MVLLPSILLTLLVYTEGIQIKHEPETLSASSDQSAQLQDLISILRLYLKATKINNNTESQNIRNDNSSRSKDINLNDGHISNNGKQQINTLNLYRKPYTPSAVKDQELISQFFLHNNANSDLKKSYENFHDFSGRKKFVENIKEPFTPPSKFYNIRENLPYVTTGDKNINSGNFYTGVNPVEDLQAISIENNPLTTYFSGDRERGHENHNNEYNNSYNSEKHFQGLVSSFKYRENPIPDNEHTYSSFQDVHNQERPKQKYTFNWNPHNSEEDIQQLNIRNERPAKLSNDNNQHLSVALEPHSLKQSFYPEIVKPSPYYRKTIKIQQEDDLRKQLEKVPSNSIVIKYLQKNDHTQNFPILHKDRSYLEAQYNLIKSTNVDNNMNELQKDELHSQSHQENIEKEVLELVIKKALDLAHATNQRPPIIIHRLVTITKHVPIPIFKHGVIHSYQYKQRNPVNSFQ